MNKATAVQQDNTASVFPSARSILQRKCACGNHTVAGGECGQCSKDKGGLQRKLTIGASNDPLEQEADRIAEQVLAAPTHHAMSGRPLHIQTFSAQSNVHLDSAPASVDHVLAGTGRPLEPALLEDMGQRFGHDFSQVRVHSGSAAAQSSRDVNANAYTAGHDIVFGEGKFAPGTNEGRRLIAHELTHVVQQRGGQSEKPGVLAVGAPRGIGEQLPQNVASRIGQRAALPMVASSAAKATTVQRELVPGAVSDPGASRLLVSCDTDRPDKKQRCNIDQLTKLAVEALSSSDRAVIRVLGVDVPGTKDLEPRAAALDRADVMRRALIQWIGPNKYPENRFDIGVAAGTEADPQVQIWVAYQAQIRSPHPTGPLRGPTLIGPRPAPAAADSGLPDIGVGKFTNHELDIEIGDLKIVVPKSAELKFKGLPYKKFPNQPSKTLQISIKGELGKLADLVKSPTKPADPALATPLPTTPTPLGPPVKLSMSVTLNGLKQIGLDLSAKADFSNKTISGGLSLTLTGGGCEFKVPATAFAKIAEAEKALRKLSPEPGKPPTADEILKKTQEAQKQAESAATAPAPNPNAPRGVVPPVAAAPQAASEFDPGPLADIAEIANTLFEAISEIDKEKTKCQKGPTIKIGPTITAPFGSDDPAAPPDPARRPNVGIGVTGDF